MDIQQIIKKNKALFVIYLISTSYFLYQYHTSTLWDFSVYVLNAKYLFYGGGYFEVLRAPLVPVLLGIFMVVGLWGRYLFILATSSFFFYTTLKISGEIFKNLEETGKKIAQLFFYFFSLSPFVLYYGLLGGTELLGLCFLEMFLYSLITGKNSGGWLGLAILTRYNFFYFSPLLLFHKKPKRIIENLLIVITVLFPWLLFNYIKYKNWFMSILDSYALNVLLRQSISENFSFSYILDTIGWFWPFLVVGLFFCVTELIKKPIRDNKINVLILLTAAIVIFDFYNTPFKIVRYLFNLALPIAFFSTIGVLFLLKKIKINKKVLVSIIVIIFLIISIPLFLDRYREREHKEKFLLASEDIFALNLSHCEILSPHWVLVTYYTENVYPLNEKIIEQEIENNKTILFFKGESDYRFNESLLNFFPIFYETEEYVFLAKPSITNICFQKYVYDKPITSGFIETTEPCQIIYKGVGENSIGKFALKLCDLIN